MNDVKGLPRIQDLPRSPSDATGSLGNALPEVGPSFKETFAQVNKPSTTAPEQLRKGSLQFSNHALERMHSRGIAFSPDDLQRLQTAVDKADKKGAKDSLVIMGDSAFVVSVKNKTVVTVMDRAMMKDNVFTKIDSTIIL